MDWPASLPQNPQVGGFEDRVEQNVITTSMDVGPAKKRLRSSAVFGEMRMEFRMTQAQTLTLDTFYYTDTKSGTISFNINHPRKGTPVPVKFKSPPSFAPIQGGIRWLARLELEVQPHDP